MCYYDLGVVSSGSFLYSMDLSWNYATESQAYDRAHRIGQEKPVFVKRLVIKDTIEERQVLHCDLLGCHVNWSFIVIEC
jgi:hypothetical protein